MKQSACFCSCVSFLDTLSAVLTTRDHKTRDSVSFNCFLLTGRGVGFKLSCNSELRVMQPVKKKNGSCITQRVSDKNYMRSSHLNRSFSVSYSSCL
jgi:hypothetical protein